jgi:hypothetical protein
MATKSKNSGGMMDYTIMVKPNVELGVTVSGESLDEALNKARELSIEDILTGYDELMDYDINIRGVWERDG